MSFGIVVIFFPPDTYNDVKIAKVCMAAGAPC